MAVTAPKSSIFIVQGLGPVEVPNFEIYLIRKPFADVYFRAYSAKGV